MSPCTRSRSRPEWVRGNQHTFPDRRGGGCGRLRACRSAWPFSRRPGGAGRPRPTQEQEQARTGDLPVPSGLRAGGFSWEDLDTPSRERLLCKNNGSIWSEAAALRTPTTASVRAGAGVGPWASSGSPAASGPEETLETAVLQVARRAVARDRGVHAGPLASQAATWGRARAAGLSAHPFSAARRLPSVLTLKLERSDSRAPRHRPPAPTRAQARPRAAAAQRAPRPRGGRFHPGPFCVSDMAVVLTYVFLDALRKLSMDFTGRGEASAVCE